MSDLKDCPFCGGKPVLERMGTARTSMIIMCEDCGATVECGSHNVKFSAWNSRSNTYERLEARVKELEDAGEKYFHRHISSDSFWATVCGLKIKGLNDE